VNPEKCDLIRLQNEQITHSGALEPLPDVLVDILSHVSKKYGSVENAGH
jgi:hypothetical protein